MLVSVQEQNPLCYIAYCYICRSCFCFVFYIIMCFFSAQLRPVKSESFNFMVYRNQLKCLIMLVAHLVNFGPDQSEMFSLVRSTQRFLNHQSTNPDLKIIPEPKWLLYSQLETEVPEFLKSFLQNQRGFWFLLDSINIKRRRWGRMIIRPHFSCPSVTMNTLSSRKQHQGTYPIGLSSVDISKLMKHCLRKQSIAAAHANDVNKCVCDRHLRVHTVLSQTSCSLYLSVSVSPQACEGGECVTAYMKVPVLGNSKGIWHR